MENISFNSHFEAKDHSPNFADQDNLPIYDSYLEDTPMPIHNHSLSSVSYDLASSCEQQDFTNLSQLYLVILFVQKTFFIIIPTYTHLVQNQIAF